MKTILRSLAGFALALASSTAYAQSAPFADSLVQSPELAPPSRGSIAGQYASVAFGPGDLSRGAFSLPLPITLPSERGRIGASFVPSYSPDSAISEWGAGWSTPNLSIYRSRISGDLDYATDERTGPWGRMVKGTDGAWYPVGLKTLVRVEESGADLVAYLTDGSTQTFRAADGIASPHGAFSWSLETVRSVLGRQTSYTWIKNASGRPFLTSVTWGGTDPAHPQYQANFEYAATPLSISDYRSGHAVVLDQRIKTVHALSLVGSAFVERYRFDLNVIQDGGSPTFYLSSLQQTFASGQQPPAVAYDYELSRAYFASAVGQRISKLDPILQQYGADVFLPNKSTAFDANLDGRPDLELEFDNRILRQTDTGYEVDALPPPSANANPVCRRAANVDNVPRTLVRMRAAFDDTNVLSLLDDSARTHTSVVVCDRTGVTQWQSTFTGDWALGPNTRLADLTRDRQPDLIRVFSGGYQAMANASTAAGYGFGAVVSGVLSPQVQADTSWIHDVNGDGIPDIVSRFGSGIVAWMGEGNLQFDPQGKTFAIVDAIGESVPNIQTYQFVFFDANNDGITDLLLSNGSAMMLFANDGNAFVQTPVPYFQTAAWASVKPVVLDVAGNGNTEIAFAQGNLAYALDLDAPGVGLLQSADDGRGTVIHFDYERAAPEVGVRYRNSLLGQARVVSTGYDDAVYQYAYGKPDLHSVGRFLLGYESVVRTGAIDSSTMTFSNTDVAPGVLLTSVEQDSLVPGIEKVEFRQYDDVVSRGVPWKRIKSEGKGWSSTDALNPTVRLESTNYVTYTNEVCASTVSDTMSAGTLTTTKTFSALSAFAKSLACIDQHATITGTHADASLDFRYEAELTRNAAGLLTRLTMFDRHGASLDTQDVTYAPDGTLATITSPGKGTSTFAWQGVTGLIASSTAPNGVVTSIADRDALTDAVRALTVNRGGSTFRRDFRFDGQERLAKSWNNMGQATEAMPDEIDTYRYASGVMPALTQVSTLATVSWANAFELDAAPSRPSLGMVAASTAPALKKPIPIPIPGPVLPKPTPTYARSAYVATAAGEAIALAKQIPEGWTFGQVTQRSRAMRRVTELTRPTVADVTTLTVPALYTSGQTIGTTQSSLFGFATTQSTSFHADVEKDVAGVLGFSSTGMTRSETENHQFSTSSTFDEGEHLVGHRDQGGAATSYVYDAMGRFRRVKLPGGALHRIDYDDFARTSSVTRDGVATITYAYDATTGLLTERDFVAPAGTPTAGSVWRRVEYAYDAFGRVTTETDVDARTGATQSWSFLHDGAIPGAPNDKSALGMLTAVVGDRYSRTMTYRADGVETSRTIAIAGWRSIQNTTTFDEDGAAHQHSMMVFDGEGNLLTSDVSLSSRDAYGRPISEQRDGSPFVSYAYDVNGLLLWGTFSGPYSHGEVVTFTYDKATRERVGLNQNNGTWASAVSVRMNTRGLVDYEDISVSKLSNRRTFAYSPEGYLSQSSDPGASYTYSYSPDALPSKIVTTANGTTETRVITASGNTLTAGTHHHAFDDIGRVVQRDGVTISYGPNGQVASAHDGTSQWTYLYDEAGNRVAKLEGGIPVAAYLADGTYLDATSTTTPLRLAGQLVALLRSSTGVSPSSKQIRLVATDLAGTVLSDEDGTPRLASPFGDRSAHPDVAAAIDYAAKGYDADLGVVRMGARDYDATFSRFLTPDPLYLEQPGKCVGSPKACNLYAYANNNPTSFVDPDGHEPFTITMGGAAAAALAFTALATTVVYYQQPEAQRAARSLSDTVSTAVRERLDVLKQKAKLGEYATPTFCSDPSAKQEKHHTFPVALMETMHAHGMIATDTLEKLTPADREGTLKVDRDTHLLLHASLSGYITSRYPGLGGMRMGFQHGADWERYVKAVETSVGNNPLAAKAKIMGDLAVFYGGVTVVQSAVSTLSAASGCPTGKTESAIGAFAHDAAEIAKSPANLAGSAP